MRVITLNENNKVVSVKNVGDKYILKANDLISDIGKIGQIMQLDGTFIDAPIEPIEPQATIEEQILSLKEDNLILMDALATTFEEVMMLREQLQGDIV